MVMTAIVRFTSSSSVKWTRTSSNSSSGTPERPSSVTASVHASAARSRSVKNGVSRQTGTA